jgi:acetylornithine deacetylase/succinyl-diaminopimelate desuccinylase-like protein
MSAAPTEVAEVCSDLIRFNTTNPGGDERLAAEYVCAFLSGLGIEPNLLELEPRRSNVVARWPGTDPTLPALLIQAHLDTVPAQSAEWSLDPFSGAIEAGNVWGRGAVDMKDAVAMYLVALKSMKLDGRAPKRDLILVFTADEETGGRLGAEYLVREHREIFEGCGVSIGEVGGFNISVEGGPTVYLISTIDKGIRRYTLRCRGTSGHGSMLAQDNPLTQLSRELISVDALEYSSHVVGAMHSLVRSLAPSQRDPGAFSKELAKTGPVSRMLIPGLSNTTNVTRIGGGYSENVIPGEAWATLDCRFLPGQEHALHAALSSALDTRTEVTLNRHTPATESPDESEWFDWLSQPLLRATPGALVAPFVFSGSTDNKWFSTLGIPTYGFTPLHLPADYDFASMFHGVDERIPISSLEFGVGVLADLFCT